MGKASGETILFSRNMPCPAETRFEDAFVGNNDRLSHSMIANRDILTTQQVCYDYSSFPFVNLPQMKIIIATIIAGIKNSHWETIKVLYKKGNTKAFQQMSELREDMLHKIKHTEIGGLAEQLSELTCSNELARINSSRAASSRGPDSVSYTHLRHHATKSNLVCRLPLEQ